TNVEDVARVAAGAVLGINKVDNTVESSRFTPTFVPPEATLVGKHAGEVGIVAANLYARPGKRAASVCIGPGSAAIGGPENFISVVVREAAAALIHSRDVQVARARVAGDLHVANKGISNVNL